MGSAAHGTVRLPRRHPRARDRRRPLAALALLVLPLPARRLHRRRRLLRAQRLHHHHDALALARPGSVGRRLVGVRPAPGDPALPRPARARRRRDRAVRRDPVGAARPRSRWRAAGSSRCSQFSALWAAGQHGSFWLPALHPFGQTWSLAIEWYFYLLWPLVVLAARSRGVRPGRLAVGSLVAAVPLYLVALPLSDFWFYFGPSARFAELLVGRRPGAVVPGRRRSRRAHAAPARPRPWAALVAIGVDHGLRPGRAQPALPLRRGAGRWCSRPWCSSTPATATPAARSTGC